MVIARLHQVSSKAKRIVRNLRVLLALYRYWQVARDYALRLHLALRWYSRRSLAPGSAVGVIVSLTSYPPRFPTLALTLKSILLQSTRPERITLWIASSDFDRLPEEVLALQAEGITIEPCEDWRSYKKLLPALARYPAKTIVTADDDVYYPRRWLARLVMAHLDSPRSIVCTRMHRIRLDDAKQPRPYREWVFDAPSDNGGDPLNFPTGIGGVLYPSGTLDPRVTDQLLSQALCPTADDLWFYLMARLRGTVALKTYSRGPLYCWRSSQDVALWRSNVVNAGNDEQMSRLLAHSAEFRNIF